MCVELQFANRVDFRLWLTDNCRSSKGVWLLFGKNGGSKTIKANEALEEALCFGWIDGQMQSINERIYKKYFSQRRENSKWSEKNKALAEALEEKGLMTELGRLKIAQAKKNGRWNAPTPSPISNEQIELLSSLIKNYEPAHSNFQAMSPSIKRTYTRAFLNAKTEEGREKRIAWIISKLTNNLKPM